jgi:hypothetical protein
MFLTPAAAAAAGPLNLSDSGNAWAAAAGLTASPSA